MREEKFHEIVRNYNRRECNTMPKPTAAGRRARFCGTNFLCRRIKPGPSRHAAIRDVHVARNAVKRHAALRKHVLKASARKQADMPVTRRDVPPLKISAALYI